MVTALMTPLIPGAGPPPTSKASRPLVAVLLIAVMPNGTEMAWTYLCYAGHGRGRKRSRRVWPDFEGQGVLRAPVMRSARACRRPWHMPSAQYGVPSTEYEALVAPRQAFDTRYCVLRTGPLSTQ